MFMVLWPPGRRMTGRRERRNEKWPSTAWPESVNADMCSIKIDRRFGRRRQGHSKKLELAQTQHLAFVPRGEPKDSFGELLIAERCLDRRLAEHVPCRGIALREAFAVLRSGVVRVPASDDPQNFERVGKRSASWIVPRDPEDWPDRRTEHNCCRGRIVTTGCLRFTILNIGALDKPAALTVVAPESPRPLELLLGVTYDREATLTADDAALHELLMTVALRDDASLENDTHAVPMRHILRYLGMNARRDAVKDSLARVLSNTVSFGPYEQVPLLVSWIERKDADDLVHFVLPAPIKTALSAKTEYAYVEISALPAMRSKFVGRLYKALVAELKATGRQWIKGGDNNVTITASVGQVADWVCFPREKDGSVRPGKLKERVLDIAAGQFKDVQAFKLEVTPMTAKTRGNPIVEVDFDLTLNPPSHHQIRVAYDVSGIRQFGGVDAAEFRVQQSVWLKASGHLLEQFPDLSHGVLFGLWTACIREMLDEQPLSDGYATRRYRGDRLRQEIARRGADQAAWAWAMEEAEKPDLVLRSKTERKELAVIGETARRERVWGDEARPVATPAPAAEVEEPEVPVPVTFEACSQIWIDLGECPSVQMVDDMVLEQIDRYGNWRGDRQKTIRVRWSVNGNFDFLDFPRWSPSKEDIETLELRLNRYIESVEYLRFLLSEEAKAEGKQMTHYFRCYTLSRSAEGTRSQFNSLASGIREGRFPNIAAADEIMDGVLIASLEKIADGFRQPEWMLWYQSWPVYLEKGRPDLMEAAAVRMMTRDGRSLPQIVEDEHDELPKTIVDAVRACGGSGGGRAEWRPSTDQPIFRRYRDYIEYLQDSADGDDGARIVETPAVTKNYDVYIALKSGRDGGVALVVGRKGIAPAACGVVTVKITPTVTKLSLAATLSTETMRTLARTLLTPRAANAADLASFAAGLQDLRKLPFGDDDGAPRADPPTKPPLRRGVVRMTYDIRHLPKGWQPLGAELLDKAKREFPGIVFTDIRAKAGWLSVDFDKHSVTVDNYARALKFCQGYSTVSWNYKSIDRCIADLHLARAFRSYRGAGAYVLLVILPDGVPHGYWQSAANEVMKEYTRELAPPDDGDDYSFARAHRRDHYVDLFEVGERIVNGKTVRSSDPWRTVTFGISRTVLLCRRADADEVLASKAVSVADDVIDIPAVDVRLVRRAVLAATGAEVTLEEAAEILDMPEELRAVLRKTGRGIRSVLERMRGFQAPQRQQEVAVKTEEGPRLEDLHGYGAAKDWGLELMRDLEDYRAGRITWDDVDSGLLLSGPPGCGKTTFARALANSLDAHLVVGSYSAWLGTKDGHQGNLLRAMRDAFHRAREHSPSILLIDEIDNFPQRGSLGRPDHNDWNRGVVNGLLECLDGAVERPGVIVIGATNHPAGIDTALLRPGRLDRHIEIGLPDAPAREAILRYHLQAAVDVSSIIGRTEGFSGADLERVARDARRMARRKSAAVSVDHVAAAMPEMFRMNRGELLATAIHELGHAVVGIVLGNRQLKRIVVHKEVFADVASQAAGFAQFAGTTSTRKDRGWWENEIATLLASVAAENLILGGHCDGSAHDLQQATDAALHMLGVAGFGRSLVSDGYGGDLSLRRHRLEPQVDEILHDQLLRASAIVQSSRGVIERLADELAEKGELDGGYVTRCVLGHGKPIQLALAV
eukprot:g25207.t1